MPKEESLSIDTDSSFKSRTDSIFGCLDSLEKKHEEYLKKEPLLEIAESGGTDRYKLDRDQNEKHSSRSNCRPFKRRFPTKVPDHLLNPQKYQKYSLKEDGTRNISKGKSADELNKRIALNFMDELKSRKGNNPGEVQTLNDTPASMVEKVTFQKPKVKSDHSATSKSIFGSSHGGKTHVMGTFEFGKKPSKKINTLSEKGNNDTTSNVVSLNFEEDGEETRVEDCKTEETFVKSKNIGRKRNIRKKNNDGMMMNE